MRAGPKSTGAERVSRGIAVSTVLRHRPIGVARFATLLCLVTATAGAQVGVLDAPLEEIQVTATRRPAAAAEVSAALSLIDREVLRGQKLTTDALAAQPGVFLQQTTPGQGAAIVRGLKGSEVLHMVDGMRMNNAIFRNAPTQYLALVSPASVERIEVLRGSPSSLYGSDAVGGVVQVINRIPEFDGASIGLRREFGMSFDTAEEQRSIYGSLDAGTDQLAMLVSANYLETGNRRTGGGDTVRPSGYSAQAFRAAVALTPDEDRLWLFDLQHGRQPETPRVDELVPGFGQTEPAAEEFFFAPNERNFLHIRHDRKNAWLGASWRFDLGWQEIVDDRRTRDFGSDVRRLEDNASRLLGASVTASGEHARGGWVVGSEFYHDDVSSRREELNLTTGEQQMVQSRFPDGSSADQAAVFANSDFRIGDRQSLSGGLRYTIVNVDLAATGMSPSANVDIDDFSADLGWQLALNDSTRLVANAGFGFRAPNVFDLGTLGERPGNRFNIPNANLESEDIIQFDLGIRHANDRYSASLVAWQFHYDNRLVSVLTGATTPGGRDVVQTRNRASADLWGFEAELGASFGNRLLANLVLNYTRGDQDDGSGSDEPADRVPPLNGRFVVDYLLTDDWVLTPYVLFAGKQDRLSARDANDSRIDPDGTDGWATINIAADWQPDDRWSLRFRASNLFDEQYRVHGSGIDAPGLNLGIDFRYLW